MSLYTDGLEGWGSLPGRGHSVQTGFAAYPAPYPVGEESGRGANLTTYFHLVSRPRMVELYLHTPIRLRGVVVNLPFFRE